MRPLFGRSVSGPGWDVPPWMVQRTVSPSWAQFSGAAGNSDGALRHSAVWAACRLRADLISTMPLDVYRQVGPIQVDVPTPAKLDQPGPNTYLEEWLYSSQIDLDRTGNAIGLKGPADGYGLPMWVDLWPSDQVQILWKPGQPTTYRYQKVTYSADQVWHERQYTVPGVPIGLSPVAYAALTIGQYQSAQEFALDWYTGGAMPSALMRNTKRKLSPAEAQVVKQRFKASVRSGEPLITDQEWELQPIAGASHDQSWLDTMNASAVEVARFFGVPSDLIDAHDSASGKSSLTYTNITQRNLQFLILNLGPAIIRREKAISRGLLPRQQFVKFNTDALLRMDPDTVSTMLAGQVAARLRTVTEARAKLNLPEYTPDQWAEFDHLAAGRTVPPTGTGVPA